MNECIEEHYKKHNKDYEVIRLRVEGNLNYSEWEEILYD
jgi:hypothetical protein